MFNPASNASHDVFKTIASASVVRTVLITVSAQILTNECNLTDYALARAASGEFTWTVPGVLANGTSPTWTT